jgi:hypothetical protein
MVVHAFDIESLVLAGYNFTLTRHADAEAWCQLHYAALPLVTGVVLARYNATRYAWL